MAFISYYTSRLHTAAQYGALASLGNSGRTVVAAFSGVVVDALGGDWAFVLRHHGCDGRPLARPPGLDRTARRQTPRRGGAGHAGLGGRSAESPVQSPQVPARQFRCLAHPACELRFVQFALVNVDPARVLILASTDAGRQRV